jgi:hypothetical protein
MLDALLAGRIDEFRAARAELLRRPRVDRAIVGRAETAVRANPAAAFRFGPTGEATLTAEGRSFAAGNFAVRSIDSLTRQAHAQRDAGHRARLFGLVGTDPATDIGALQATASPASLFQVASQFNCLEAPDAMVVPVEAYFRDPTQGPRASISAFPGTLLRHYAAPAADGTRFVQSAQRQLNLLAEALPERVGRVNSGYLMTQHIADLREAAESLEHHFERIAVGVHDELDVCFGHSWDGEVIGAPRIAQVFTSTLALGYSEGLDDATTASRICVQLLRAAYLGTLLSAAALRKRTVVLTLIGGGVFGNAHPMIAEAIAWALEKTDRLLAAPLDVLVNARLIDATALELVLRTSAARGGACLQIDAGEVKELRTGSGLR